MTRVINTYKLGGRLVNSLRISSNITRLSIVQNDFLPPPECYAYNKLKLISIISGDFNEDSFEILNFLNRTKWPAIIISRHVSMRISLKYTRAGALDCVSSSICSDLLLAKCINIFRLMDKPTFNDFAEDTRAVLSIDYKKRIIRADDGTHIKLTASETTFLGLLAERRSECLSRDELLSRNITGNDTNYRSLNVLISRLRTKLETITNNKVIDSVRGYGYSLGEDVELLNAQASE